MTSSGLVGSEICPEDQGKTLLYVKNIVMFYVKNVLDHVKQNPNL